MAELLLELFSEEIPARMQRGAAELLKSRLAEGLAEAKLDAGDIRTFVTPRRLVAVIDGLPTELAATSSEKRGPRVGAPQGAIDGFCRSAGITADRLEERDGFYFAVVTTEGGAVAPLLKSIIEKLLAGFHWPKTMRWGARPLHWVRPLQSLLCLFDGKVIPVEFGGLTAGDTTRGHRFLSDGQPITIRGSEDYFARLRDAHVVVDQDERKLRIEQGAAALAAKHQLQVKPDAGLLEEVTGLVEWPVVLMGGFEQRYLALPQEVPTTVMRSHQKYFALQDTAGKLASHFIVVSNMVAGDGGKAITAGNERVLRARLSDGQFFYDQDLKQPLSDWAHGLSDMVFHAKAGSVADKVTRIRRIAAQLATKTGADVQDTDRAALLCKCDLTTGMVGEFPELQGLMGRYYALAQNEKPAVADAIRDHYAPQGPSDACPSAPVSVVVALADKLDTLVELFRAGEKPTGSKDPFALRRAALGVIRLILENRLRLNLWEFIENAELREFFIARLKVSLRDEGIGHDRIDAVLERDKGESDLTRLVARVRALDAFLKTAEGANLLAAAKRALNITRPVKDAPHAADAALLQQAEEKALYDHAAKTGGQVDSALAAEDYHGAMQALAALRPAIDAFFDKVTVNADDAKLRANRLGLLNTLNGVFIKIADFSLIEG